MHKMSFRKQELLRLKRNACDSRTSGEVYESANDFICKYAEQLIDHAIVLAGDKNKTIKTADIKDAFAIMEGNKRIVTDYAVKPKKVKVTT